MNSSVNLTTGKFASCLVAIFSWGSHLMAAESVAYTPPAAPTEGNTWKAAGRAVNGALIESDIPAWRIAAPKGQSLNYILPEPESRLQEGFEKGWKFTAKLRLDTKAFPTIGKHLACLGVESAVNHEAFVLSICSDPDGAYAVLNTKKIPLPNLDVSQWHEYSLVYDPAKKSVELLVDGTAVQSDLIADKTERNMIRWGHQSINAAGAADWANVQFETL